MIRVEWTESTPLTKQSLKTTQSVTALKSQIERNNKWKAPKGDLKSIETWP